MGSIDQPKTLLSYKALTFDCYGTLVDWEGGIYKALQPLTSQLPPDHPLLDRAALLKGFTAHEARIQIAQPKALYREVLSQSYSALAEEVGVSAPAAESEHFGRCVGAWPAFRDTVKALQSLKKHYKLVILSNVDRESFQRTLDGPLSGVTFDAIYTAQEIGSYKPALSNFEYLISHVETELGVPKAQILHTAQSLVHDVRPATDIGLTNAWIERGEDTESVMGGKIEEFEGKVKIDFRFKNMGEMAAAVEREAHGQ